jgi:type VI secretion system protein ImpJ
MTPHHLQQQDLYHEAYVDARLEAVEPLGWGVVSAAIDRRALHTGQIALESFTGILPGGLALNLDAQSPEMPPSRLVEGHFPHNQTSLDVYLGVPREREGGSNYAEIGAGRRTRFVHVTRSIADGTGTAAPQEITFAQRNVVLLFGDEPREDFDAFKITELVRDNAGGLVVSDPYIPPCVRIGASPFLIAGLRRLLGAMSTRRKTLVEAQRERGDASIEYNSTDITRFLLLNGINTFLPVMSHMVDTGDMHPRAAYLLLVQLAGQLSSFSVQIDPANLPKFVFTDLRGTFEALFATITSLLHTSFQEQYVALQLEARADGIHFGRLADERFRGCDRFFLAVRSSKPTQDVAAAVPRLAKVASWSDMGDILTAATPGAPVEVNFRPPPEIPIKAGITYFTVSTKNDYWQRIATQREISVFLPTFTPEDCSIQVLGIPGGGGAGLR